MSNSNTGTGITAAGFGLYSIGWNVVVTLPTPGLNSFGALMKAQLRKPVAFLPTYSGCSPITGSNSINASMIRLLDRGLAEDGL